MGGMGGWWGRVKFKKNIHSSDIAFEFMSVWSIILILRAINWILLEWVYLLSIGIFV
ncbi:hypothetical protein ABH948_002383 [Bacillus sp. RC218]